MLIADIDHVTVRVRPDDVERLRGFYVDLLGLEVGPRALSFPGLWLRAGGRVVLHIAGNLPAEAGATPGADVPVQGFDHVAFRTTGLDSAKRRLDDAGVPWREVWRPHLDILQLVLHDPIGTKIELTFDPAEHRERPAG